MQEFDTVIAGGLVVTAGDRTVCDIGIRGGKVAALGQGLTGRRVIDASGKYVLPGGVDSHVHIAQPSGEGIVMADDFESGTRSAALGGTTTIMPFCLQERDVPMRQTLQAYHDKAEGECYVDVSFHLIVSAPDNQLLGQDLPALVEDGYTSFKIFMTYDDLKLNDRQILDVMAVARETGALVMVHAENYDAIRFMTEQLEKAGRTAPRYHATSRPKVAEREATHRAISLAELVDVPVMIVHVSNRESMEQIRWAQQRGLPVLGETCTQYLVLTEDDLDGLGMEGAKYVCSPPPRDRESQEACWEGLRTGVFTVFSSDHCPYRYDDEQGKLNPKGRSSFRWVPNGIPGVGARLPILFSEGVSKGRMTLENFVAVTAANPARTYGLYPRKGTIAVGSDADIVLWDPERRVTLQHEHLRDGADYTPYAGMEITGWPVLTLVRGQTVVDQGELVGAKGLGTYLPRDRSPFASPAARQEP
ncbi:dihydropyrimidinase [Aureimonas frigidaquae]|uniref:Phenylhydantoinase n=1 Tax=Aureimonas frigidaquae TaxID=424757 RepID=A0A0P0Z0H0_9HYPH|nr:dihydropyrimidinase [Aureimonas frigidaquae]BAT27467.1 phenylhydantoinase [Aureimonas frigidaquae]